MTGCGDPAPAMPAPGAAGDVEAHARPGPAGAAGDAEAPEVMAGEVTGGQDAGPGDEDVRPRPDDPTEEQLARALEAVCFVLARPLATAEAATILGVAADRVTAVAETLSASLQGRGLMLQRHQGEIQLVTRPEAVWAVHRALNPERPGRLSRAALETLAIVAYRQPLTRAAVEAIRGVNCEGVLDNLERRELITEVGRQDTPGHPRLFGTTLRFLQVVGLERVDDLPPLPSGDVPHLPEADWPAGTVGESALPAGGVGRDAVPEPDGVRGATGGAGG